MYKLILLDVDGTLGKPKSGGDFRETADDWEFFPGRIEACQKLVADGSKIITCSNQGGVCFSWSKFNEEQITVVLESTAKAIGAMASLVACSSTNAKALDRYRFDDPRRKPAPGMLLEAMKMAGVSASETLMVGDRSEDQDAAKNCGVAFMWSHEFFLEK
ncbi:MAG: HAD-IIIA family hydrolase [Ktedonobacteraceae bacterium]